jgi:hypothetical protein
MLHLQLSSTEMTHYYQHFFTEVYLLYFVKQFAKSFPSLTIP